MANLRDAAEKFNALAPGREFAEMARCRFTRDLIWCGESMPEYCVGAAPCGPKS